MAKVVRYLDENGSFQFATVNDIGEMSQLLTIHKNSVVEAINELHGQGSAKEIQEIINGDISNLNDRYQAIVKDILLKADLETVNGQLSKKVDITEYLEEYNKIFDALKDKVNMTEYTATYEDVVSKLKDKVDNTEFHKLEGKFSTMETEIINLDDEISQRLRKSEFDDAVGVNKWVVTKYRVTDDSVDVKEIIPNFDLLARSKSLEVRELEDKTDMAFYKESRTITHYFTNVFVDTDKEVIVDVTYSDAFAMYMNSAMIYQNKANNKATVSISMSLRSGWNTIEMILGTSDIFPTLNIVNNISSSVDKMTTTIGVGDKNESRLINTETAIKQTSDEILLKADKLVVENIGNRVTNNEASIKVANDKIDLKVEKEEFDNYSKRLETAESSLEIQSESIKAKVETTEFNLLNEKVNSNTSSIEVLEGEIELKVSKEEYDGLKEQVSSAETSISLNTESIKLKAEKTELDGVDDRLKNTETSLEVAIGSIESKVSKSEYDTKVSEMVNAIKDAMDEAKVANEKLLELSDDDKLSPSEKQSTKLEWSSIEVEFPLIMSQANNYGLTVDDKKLYDDKFKVLKSYIEPIVSNLNTITEISGAEFRRHFTEYYQARTSVQTIILEKAKALSDKAMDRAKAIGEEVVQLGGRVNATETSITQTAEEIKSKADKSTVYTISDIDEKLGTIDLEIKNANTEITQSAEKISQKANSSDVYTKIEADDFLDAKAGVESLNALVTRVETAESELVQTSEEIALTAKKHEIESIDNRVRGIELNADVNKLKWKSITVSPFGMNDESQIIKDILALNVNSVTIPILCDVPSVNSNQVVIKAQSYNRAKRIMSLMPVEYQMILKPQIFISEGEVEASILNPTNKATFISAWKDILIDVTGYMLAYDNLGAIHIADSMKNLEGEFEKWRDIVTSLRVLNEDIQIVYEVDSWEVNDIVINSNARFSSVLNNPMMELSDVISVKASFPLTPLPSMTSRELADLIKRPNKIEGKSIIQQMEELNARWKKNVFIGDIRIAPYDGMYSKPWSDAVTGLTYSKTTQSHWLQAWHDALNGQEWFKGFSAYSISEQDSPFNLIDDARNIMRILTLGGFGESIQLIDKRVTANEASLSVQSHEIKTKVSFEQYEGDINRFGERLTSAESSITQNANAIALTVSSETYVTGIKALDDKINSSIAYTVQIVSTNGNSFLNGDIDTSLQAYVFNGKSNVTDVLDASRFIWKRDTGNASDDLSWSIANSGKKAVLITSDSFHRKVIFTCEIKE